MPTSGTRPLSCGEQLERPAVEAGDDRHVDVAGAPAAALGEQHDRQPAPLGELEQAVLLHVVAHALGAGQDGVVVGHRHARLAVDGADARDEAVGGRAGDQLLARCGAAPARRTAAARTRRSCPRRAGPRGSRGRCGGRARAGGRRHRAGRRRGRPRGARAPRAGRRARRPSPRSSRVGAAPRRPRPLRGRERQQQLALLDGVADRDRELADARRRSRRAPRAPSSSPRARPPARRRRRARSLRGGSATTTPAKGAFTAVCSVAAIGQIIADRGRARHSRSERETARASARRQQLACARWASSGRRATAARAPRGAQAGARAGPLVHPLPRAGGDPQDGRLRRRQRGCRADVRGGGARARARTSRGCRSWGAPGSCSASCSRRSDLRRDDVFIANTLKCRPPGNRDPQPVEIENCREYLLRQVELIEPSVICSLGNFSTKLLRADPTGITRLHGQPEVIELGQPRGAAVPDLPPRRRPLHAAHARDAARGLLAPAGAARARPARAARAGRSPCPSRCPPAPAGAPRRRRGTTSSGSSEGAPALSRRRPEVSSSRPPAKTPAKKGNFGRVEEKRQGPKVSSHGCR